MVCCQDQGIALLGSSFTFIKEGVSNKAYQDSPSILVGQYEPMYDASQGLEHLFLFSIKKKNVKIKLMLHY